MGFLFKAAAAALVGTITVLIVLATLIEAALPAPADGRKGLLYLAAWFATLAALWLVVPLARWSLRWKLRFFRAIWGRPRESKGL